MKTIIKFYREIWQNAHCFPNALITQLLSVCFESHPLLVAAGGKFSFSFAINERDAIVERKERKSAANPVDFP